MGRIESLTRELKRYDSKLYVDRCRTGTLCVFRKSHQVESYDIDGVGIDFVLPTSHLIFALTDNWNISGNPAEWGALPILARLKSIDLWNRGDIAKEMEREYERDKESEARDTRNNMEAFLYDYRSTFARTFNDVNVANMSKKIKGE